MPVNKKYSSSEENYVKHIFLLSYKDKKTINAKTLSEKLNFSTASITNMTQRLEKMGLITYQRYYGVAITPQGKCLALKVLRKHRIWETFLFRHLKFDWSEVHQVAEELEHISSEKLIDRLDAFLNFPKIDPHGDPIPTKHGSLPESKDFPLVQLKEGKKAILQRVATNNSEFLSYLKDNTIDLGVEIELIKFYSFDTSFKILLHGKRILCISKKIAEQLFVEEVS